MPTRPPVTLAKLLAELEHVQNALGDVMRTLDDHGRCLRVLLKLNMRRRRRK